jgi:OmcA/MtrC family decaheme c-type cytochrome
VHKFKVKKNNKVEEYSMQKRTIFMPGLMPALAILLVGTSSMFAQVQLAHYDVLSPPESCAICHSGDGEKKHQAIYDNYADASSLELTIDSVTSIADGAGAFNATMTFTILKNGLPYLDVDGLPSLEQKRFYTVTYDSTTRMFDNSVEFSNPVALGNGQYSVTTTGITYDLNNSKGQAYGYIADGLLDTESGGHVQMYDDVANAGLAFGDVTTYQSAANVSGCEKCHGKPYMKHGYRAAEVEGLSDFSSCKSCHYDTRDGGHEDWQILVNEPARYAEIHAGAELTAEEETQYAYIAKLMNDVHMAHAMEFPYPQSMSNCATCHEGKLDVILSNTNFKGEVCKSCHPVTGPEGGTDPHRAPALRTIMPSSIHGNMDLNTTNCTLCHRPGGAAPAFSKIHTGYDKHIYAANDGTRYSDVFTASVDAADFTGNILTIDFSVTKNIDLTTLEPEDVIPTVLIGLYGYDTKDFIVAAHDRDADENRLLEFQVDGVTTNPRFTVALAEGGKWKVTADLSMWADMIADGKVKRAEISILPLLADIVGEIDSHSNGETDDTAYAINAPSRTFDLLANAFDDNFYSNIVDVAGGCNKCHDALATTFHSPNRGGNIKVCRTCHVGLSGASHLEMQSRSIDSYVHAIHSFQAFDIGDVNFLDPVEALYYDLHIEHVFPNFTIKNCEACHVEGAFEVPDQSKSMPGILSGSDSIETWDRNIGDVPAYITGPGSRACGSCHRAEFIKEDEAGELISFNQHTKQGGYLIEEGADDEETQSLLMTVINYIMGLFD